MKHAGIEVQIARLVVDASLRGEATGLADAIGAALRERIPQSASNSGAAPPQDAPHLIADRIATQMTATSSRSGIAEGKP
jgi:hypothetical protein